MLRAAVYAPHEAFDEPGLANGNGRAIGFVDALNEALHQEMESDPRVVVMGEDVAATGGIFGATRGLLEKYGGDRVRDTPISEAGFVGCGIGAAIRGAPARGRDPDLSTSSPSPWTCWSTRPRSSGSCWGGRTPCRW